MKLFDKILEQIEHLKMRRRGEGFYTLCSISAWAKKNGLPLLPAGEMEQIPYVNPPMLNKDGYRENSPPLMSSSNAPYIAELRNAVIYSQSSIIIAGRCALLDTATHPLYGKFVDLKYEKPLIKQYEDKLHLKHADYKVSKLDAGIFLSGLATNAFGHWIQEFLPKLQFLEAHPDFHKLPIIVDEQMPQSHFDLLAHIVKNPIIRIAANTGLRCKRLLVASTPSFIPVEVFHEHTIPLHELGPVSPSSLRFLRDRVLQNVKRKHSQGRKLYLSRRNMMWRLLENETEIAGFLTEQGFETIDAEKLSFAEQIQMFQEADCIVAPCGSAILNIIFSTPPLKLIVLAQPVHYPYMGVIYGPLRELGYSMIFVTGDEMHEWRHANYVVPVDRVREALALANAQ